MKGVANLVPISMLAILATLFFSGGAHAETSTTQTSMEVDSVIDISSPGKVTLTCTPGSTAASAELCTSNASILVTTNNITGYTLQMNITSGNSTNLTNTAVSPSATIPTLSQAYSSANFPINSWGYTGGLDKSGETGGYDCSTNYCPVLAYNSDSSAYAPNHTIRVTDAASTASNTTITFAGKVDTSKPSGTYTSSVTFTAITNYVPHPITNGMSMTDIDYSTCADTPEDVTYTVVDPRDNTNYTVAKLQDGNCWMTQNLELGQFGTPMNLTSATSNVSSSGYTLTFDYANASTYKGNSNKYGNYYTFLQATAGSGNTTQSANIDSPYDICPKGWRLPLAYPNSISISEYYKMLNPYITTGTWSNDHWSNTTISEWTSAPLSLVLSGSTNPDGSLRNQGAIGILWYATSGGSANGFFSGFTTTGNEVHPRERGMQSYGNPIRCLVKGPPQPIVDNMYMQDVTQDRIAVTPTDTTYTLKDKRDETSYTVAKLQDGNLWMTQNLELGEYGTPMNLTDTLSNVSSSGYTLTFNYASNSAYKGNSNKCGNYYNYSQATAGSGPAVADEDAPYDVCPKGWRLPSAGVAANSIADNEFYIMLNNYITTGTPRAGGWDGTTVSEWTGLPVSLLFSGFMYSDGSIEQDGLYGVWWYATSNGPSNAIALDVYSYGDINLMDSPRQNRGIPIRCLMPGS